MIFNIFELENNDVNTNKCHQKQTFPEWGSLKQVFTEWTNSLMPNVIWTNSFQTKALQTNGT